MVAVQWQQQYPAAVAAPGCSIGPGLATGQSTPTNYTAAEVDVSADQAGLHMHSRSSPHGMAACKPGPCTAEAAAVQ